MKVRSGREVSEAVEFAKTINMKKQGDVRKLYTMHIKVNTYLRY